MYDQFMKTGTQAPAQTFTYGGIGANLTPAQQNTLRAAGVQPAVIPAAPAAPAAAPAPSAANNVGSTASYSSGPSAAQVAAQAAAAAKAAQDAKNQAYINDQVAGATAGLNRLGDSAGYGYQGQGTQLANQIQTGENAINQARTNIGVSQINSIKSLIDNIKSGLHSSAVGLGNSNALDSSAADAISRIYSQYGNTQRNVINNDAAVKNADQDVQQHQLDLQENSGLALLDAYKRDQVNNILTQAQQQLTQIDGYAHMMGLTNPVDIEGIKQAVVNHAQGLLADADKTVQAQIHAIGPQGADEIAKNAYDLSNRGVAGSGGITYNQIQAPQDPATQLGGASNSQMPLYLKPKIS